MIISPSVGYQRMMMRNYGEVKGEKKKEGSSKFLSFLRLKISLLQPITNASFLIGYILEENLYSDLYQHVKEHHRKRLFRFDDAKDIKKIPFQPLGIEKGMILGKWEWFWEWIGKINLRP